MKRYHKSFGYPDEYKSLTGRIKLFPSDHARERARDRDINLPEHLTVTEEMYDIDPEEAIAGNSTVPHIFEMWVDHSDDIVVRVNMRYHRDGENDKVVVFDRHNSLITTWLNDRGSSYHDPDLDKYDLPPRKR